jgi:hypothetical protein
LLPLIREPDEAPDYEADDGRKDALMAHVLQWESIRALIHASICAGLLALDRERYADRVQKGVVEYPIFALLMRDLKTPLDADAAAALSDVTWQFVKALVPLSPAAQLLDWGHTVPLHQCQTNSGSARIIGSTPLWPREVVFSVFVRGDTLEAPVLDAARTIARQLLDFAPDHLDKLLFSNDAGINAAPRGLLHNVKPIELAAGGAVESAIDPKSAAAGVVCVVGHQRQVKTLEQRGVLISSAVPKESALAVAKDAVVSTFRPMRVEAMRKDDRVRLRFCVELAWGLAKPGGLRLMKGV